MHAVFYRMRAALQIDRSVHLFNVRLRVLVVLFVLRVARLGAL